MMDKKKTTGEKVLDFLERNSPEKLDAKFVDSLDKLLAEAAKEEPLTEQQSDKSYCYSGESIFLSTFMGAIAVGFCYLVYLMIF